MSNAGLSQEIITSGDKMVQLIKEGKVRMHIMGNSSFDRYGDIEHKETVDYGDFIKTRFCNDLMNLTGTGYYE